MPARPRLTWPHGWLLAGSSPSILLVPSIAYDEAKEALAAFENPDPEYVTELSSEIQANQRKRRSFAAVILFILHFIRGRRTV